MATSTKAKELLSDFSQLYTESRAYMAPKMSVVDTKEIMYQLSDCEFTTRNTQERELEDLKMSIGFLGL
jgi:hypothetical protein